MKHLRKLFISLALVTLGTLTAHAQFQTSWYGQVGMDQGVVVPNVSSCTSPAFFYLTTTSSWYVCTPSTGRYLPFNPSGPSTVGSISVSSQSADISSTTLFTSPNTGNAWHYRLCADIQVSPLGATAYVVPQVVITYAQNGIAAKSAIPTGGYQVKSNGGYQGPNGCTEFSTDPNTAVTVSTSGYMGGTGGTMQFALQIGAAQIQ